MAQKKHNWKMRINHGTNGRTSTRSLKPLWKMALLPLTAWNMAASDKKQPEKRNKVLANIQFLLDERAVWTRKYRKARDGTAKTQVLPWAPQRIQYWRRAISFVLQFARKLRTGPSFHEIVVIGLQVGNCAVKGLLGKYSHWWSPDVSV